MRKIRLAVIVAFILVIPATAYAYYEYTAGCALSDCGCP